MKPKKILLLGCGDIGGALATNLLAAGHQVLAVRRDLSRLPPAVPGLSLDYRSDRELVQLSGAEFDLALWTPTPARGEADAYEQGFLHPARALLKAWPGIARGLVMVSSTRVYGEHDGGWVSAETPPAPLDAAAQSIVAAEQLLLDSPHSVSVVRFSGIYGRWPSRLIERLQRGEVCAAVPPRFSNRIHREDCLGCLQHLLEMEQRAPVYLASDSMPVLQREMEEWLLETLGVKIKSEQAATRGSSRRCDNSLLLESGYSLRYPDYQSGYRAMINSTSMSTPRGRAAT